MPCGSAAILFYFLLNAVKKCTRHKCRNTVRHNNISVLVFSNIFSIVANCKCKLDTCTVELS